MGDQDQRRDKEREKVLMTNKQKIEEYGHALRFATPVLITVVGYLLNAGIMDIREDIRELKKQMTIASAERVENSKEIIRIKTLCCQNIKHRGESQWLDDLSLLKTSCIECKKIY